MLTDLECAILCQALYDGKNEAFDRVLSTSGVDYAIKEYSDCTLILFEGSHDIPDWLSNFRANLIRVAGFGGVEAGFFEGMEDTYAVASKYIPPDKPVYVVGHSRGAGHAHIFARRLILAGFKPENVLRVVWGSPYPGDAFLAQGLRGSPVQSYRNYRNMLEQDFICVVPEPVPVIAPYMHPGDRIVIDVAPLAHDPWLFLSRHHMYLYLQYLQEAQYASN